MNIYQGFDPTAPTLHIGHTVMMRKLEDFRKLGHNVIFLIGDFTARVGDPSDKLNARDSARKVLSKEEISENLKLYVKQASSFIDIDNRENPVRILYNSAWLEKLNFGDIVNLASEFTVQQMLKRSMFQKRLEDDKPIYINEFLYPLMQAYDCVSMDIDVEVGGNDQLFNMLVGREMIKNHLGKEKIVIAGKLLTTNEGAKMGKSEGNMIKLSDTPNEIFGKVMAFNDDQIIGGFELLTNAQMKEVEIVKKRLEDGENPMILKKELAHKLTSEITSIEEADSAREYFESIFQNKDMENEQIEEISVDNEEYTVCDLMCLVELAPSKSQARRLIEQGAVKIDDKKISNWQESISLQTPITLKVGRGICRILYRPK